MDLWLTLFPLRRATLCSVQPTDIGSGYAIGIELEVSDMLSTDKTRFRVIEQP